MRVKGAAALIGLLAACGATAGCAPGGGPVAQVREVLSCGRVVDADATGYLGGPLTAGRAIGLLSALRQADGAARVATGKLSGADRGTLDVMAVELMGYSGSRLSGDAQAFARAEFGYSPNGSPPDTSYARPLEHDIVALERDCPPAQAAGVQRAKGEGR